jgi:hypothetical protein
MNSRLARVESPPPARQRGAKQKNCLYIFCFCARHFLILKKKVIFLRGSAAPVVERFAFTTGQVWRHGGGAERIGFFQEFLLK